MLETSILILNKLLGFMEVALEFYVFLERKISNLKIARAGLRPCPSVFIDGCAPSAWMADLKIAARAGLLTVPAVFIDGCAPSAWMSSLTILGNVCQVRHEKG